MSVLLLITTRGQHGLMQESETKQRNVLWVSAHPEPCSLNGSLRHEGIERLRNRGHIVVESDLYAMNWDPVVRADDGEADSERADERFRVSADTRRAFVARSQRQDVSCEQSKLVRADAIVVQYPLWWYGMPAILKGWFDRVFVSGFAFGTDPGSGRRLRFEHGPFVGKRALVLTTLGDRARAIGPRGKSGELSELLFGLLHGTFAYTGMSVLPPWALASADRIETIDEARADLFRRLDGLFIDAPIPYRPQFTGEYTDEWDLESRVLPGETGLSIHVTT